MQNRETASLLDLLRGTGLPRPDVDPELAGGLREWLEDSLSGSAALLAHGGPVVRVERRLLASESQSSPTSRRMPSGADVAQEEFLERLVRCLFRQWITARHIGSPLEDALDALAVSGDPDGTVEKVNRLGRKRRSELSAEVARHAANISSDWPELCAAWYPRTTERISIPLCGGRILLGSVVDLVIGAQAADEATVCMVQVGARTTSRANDRAELHFCALLETLRAGAAPCRVARYSTGSGELHVDPVDEHDLVGALLKTIESAQRACAFQAEETHIEQAGRR